ncbi:uncharacterized protein MKZ38_010188 [Zalerion maritima]|uniref:CCHC-type domain-containing protein n=1 Tax=Zalerion maritima TaxID=339359 RepID=A0AAD5WV95_9PEZI|nr:uncharacterized protein MKZ38_010188 [Zalerion maritima]
MSGWGTTDAGGGDAWGSGGGDALDTSAWAVPSAPVEPIATSTDVLASGGDDSFNDNSGGFSAPAGDDLGGDNTFNEGLDDEHRPQNDVTCRMCNEPGHFSKDCPNKGPPPSPCRYCKSPEHWSNDCPEKPEGPEPCFRCGEIGHRLRDCLMPVVCRVCEKEGHTGKECPNVTCKNCGETGHWMGECSNPRHIDRSHIPDITGESAWKKIEAAAIVRDIDDLKEAIDMYVKAIPETTYAALEEAFRSQNVKAYIMALERPSLAMTLTNMDLQGNIDKKYAISYRFSDKPVRPKEREGWPSCEENKERLANAGEPITRLVPKCMNCNQLGHISKTCTEVKNENLDKPTIKCILCEEEGHRARDCPNEREKRDDRPPRECRNCGSTEHIAKDCDQPRKAGDDVECHKCHEMGHFSRDCPNSGGGGGGSMACYNCNQEGHMSRDCTEPHKPHQVGNSNNETEGGDDFGDSAGTNAFGGENTFGGDGIDGAGGNNDVAPANDTDAGPTSSTAEDPWNLGGGGGGTW